MQYSAPFSLTFHGFYQETSVTGLSSFSGLLSPAKNQFQLFVSSQFNFTWTHNLLILFYLQLSFSFLFFPFLLLCFTPRFQFQIRLHFCYNFLFFRLNLKEQQFPYRALNQSFHYLSESFSLLYFNHNFGLYTSYCILLLPVQIILHSQFIKYFSSCSCIFIIIQIYMSHPFFQGISDIVETQIMSGSRTSAPYSPRSSSYLSSNRVQPTVTQQSFHQSRLNSELAEQQPPFFQLREYVLKTLNSWGLRMGYLTETKENKLIIKCLMDLISMRFKDQETKQELRKSVSQMQYQKKKYQSLLEQERVSISEKNKTIGRLENTLNDLKSKLKSYETLTKKQRQEDKKVIGMLKNKNEQILHEMKKKDQEVNRVKQQMKKNVGQKNAFKNPTFEVYEALPKEPHDQKNDKISLLTEKFEGERKNLLKQNLLLRQKIFDIRQQIVGFAEWIDENLFKQKNSSYKNKLVVNHNLLFKKQSIVVEFNQIIQDAKTGLKEIISMHEDDWKALRARKNDHPNQIIGTRKKSIDKKDIKDNEIKKRRQTMPVIAFQKKDTTREKPQMRQKDYQMSISRVGAEKLQFMQDESEFSMISHISSKDIVAEGKQLDKWDILFRQQ